MTTNAEGQLRAMILAHKALLVALLATHPDKARLADVVREVQDQMHGLLLASHLDDAVVDAFDAELQSICRKAGL